MSFVKCTNGHLYDEQYRKCPYCGDPGRKRMLDQTVTERFWEEGNQREDDESVTENYSDSGVVTIGYTTKKGEGLISGWLVCIDGGDRGRDYPLYRGCNRIGRSYRMDVCIATDRSISRENHCSVIYDDKNNLFYVVEGRDLTYLNDKLLRESSELHDRDIIQIGNTKLEFVAFCKGERKWN